MKTFTLKPKDITRKWYVLDASEVPLGRLSTVAASLLLGKGKTTLNAHIDGGDYVIVINADSLVTTGNKQKGKIYYRHSGFPGGIKQKNLEEAASANPEKVVQHAIRGMLPANKLRKGRLDRLKIYRDKEHQHEAQSPQKMTLGREGK